MVRCWHGADNKRCAAPTFFGNETLNSTEHPLRCMCRHRAFARLFSLVLRGDFVKNATFRVAGAMAGSTCGTAHPVGLDGRGGNLHDTRESICQISTARGFEPLRAEPNGFLVHHLNHSVTLSLVQGQERKPDTENTAAVGVQHHASKKGPAAAAETRRTKATDAPRKNCGAAGFAAKTLNSGPRAASSRRMTHAAQHGCAASVSCGVRTHAQLPEVDLKSTPLTTRAN